MPSFFYPDRIGRSPVPYFSNRDELQDIEQRFSARSTSLRVMTLVGLGGSGKTQLELKYAWMQKNEYEVVLWFNAASMEALYGCLERVACLFTGMVHPMIQKSRATETATTEDSTQNTALTLYQSRHSKDIELIKKELRRRQQRFLCIFDGADEPSVIDQLPRYFPHNLAGDVIVSPRRMEASQLATEPELNIEVKGLPEESACELLLYQAGITQPNEHETRKAEEIVKRLDYIALAIDLAGR